MALNVRLVDGPADGKGIDLAVIGGAPGESGPVTIADVQGLQAAITALQGRLDALEAEGGA